jgi:dihydroneopterin aldolase
VIGVIELRSLRCSAVVGVLDHERESPQPLSFDLDLTRNIESAALNDDLSATTNYAEVLERVVNVASEGEFLLLETLAYRVALEVLACDPEIERVVVTARKLRPPVPEDVATVGVRVELDRD